MKEFREVKASERLPEEKLITYTDKGRLIYHPDVKQWRTLAGRWMEISINYWLEPIDSAQKIREAKIIIQTLMEYGQIHTVEGVRYHEGTHREIIERSQKWLYNSGLEPNKE